MLASHLHAIGLVIISCTLYRRKIPHLTLCCRSIGLRNGSAVQIAPLSRWNRTTLDSARQNTLSLTACTAASGSQQKQVAQRLRYNLRTSVARADVLAPSGQIYSPPPSRNFFLSFLLLHTSQSEYYQHQQHQYPHQTNENNYTKHSKDRKHGKRCA